MKKLIIKIVKILKFFNIVDLIKVINRMTRKITYFSHWVQYVVEWSVNNPEHFDHFVDQYWQWPKTRNYFPWERGVFAGLSVKKDAKVLDLCCGDGFNSYHFYSVRAKNVIGVDFDPKAIKWAKKNFKLKNLEFHLADIRLNFPYDKYDNIIWDAGIEHFTVEEINQLMISIKQSLKSNGILSGYTIIEPLHGGKHLHQHEYEFHNKEDLKRFLKPHFRNIHIFSTEFPSRINLYFYASDDKLPFESEDHLYFKKN